MPQMTNAAMVTAAAAGEDDSFWPKNYNNCPSVERYISRLDAHYNAVHADRASEIDNMSAVRPSVHLRSDRYDSKHVP